MHSNIVFSNGLLDPWHGGGVMRDVSDTVVSLVIPEVRARRQQGMGFALWGDGSRARGERIEG